jgi:hypothetical protein
MRGSPSSRRPAAKYLHLPARFSVDPRWRLKSPHLGRSRSSWNQSRRHIEEGDARYWVLRVNESRIADSDYFDDLVHEIEHGGREAFAHFLLNLNVAKFVSKRDVPRDNAERREIISHSLNPYDARCWLWDCAVSEQILGMEITMTDGILGCVAWREKGEYKFGELSHAYRRWQATIRTRVAPRPTPLDHLGEVLSKAGFSLSRDKLSRKRILPSADACIEALADPKKDWSHQQ